MNDIQNIQIVLARMAELLRSGGLSDWARAFESFRSELQQDPSATTAKILSMYGGMGSLNDLVLYKDGKVLAQENDELDALRSRLYELCRS
jgi:hypothetical protein